MAKKSKGKFVKVPCMTFDAMMAMPKALKACKGGVAPEVGKFVRPEAPVVHKAENVKVSVKVAKAVKKMAAVSAAGLSPAKKAWLTRRARLGLAA